MGRHSAPSRRGPILVTGAAAGLLTATGLVVGFAPDLSTHALERPPTFGAAAPTAVDVWTPSTSPSPTPSASPSPDTTTRSTDTTASRSTPRETIAPTDDEPTPTTSSSTTSKGKGTPDPNSTRKPGQAAPTPTTSSSPSPTTDPGLLGLLPSIPVLP